MLTGTFFFFVAIILSLVTTTTIRYAVKYRPLECPKVSYHCEVKEIYRCDYIDVPAY